MNLDLELDKLRYELRSHDWLDTEIDSICDMASDDFNEIILDVVSNAVAEAVDFATDLGAEEFVDEVQVTPDANGFFRISTHSGRTDFSRERQQMLPHLLKNAETSETGHRYKVIPVTQKQENKVELSMFSVLQARQNAIDSARAALRDKMGGSRSARANTMADAFRQSMHGQLATKRRELKVSTPKSEVTFRTASDKQNPATSWVIPEKDMDMTSYLTELNQRIAETITDSVKIILDSYRAQYMQR